MSLLAQRLGIQTNEQSKSSSIEIMYSPAGAAFQERCLAMVGSDKSLSKLIGNLVTEINNNRISVSDATTKFNDALWAGRN